MNIKRNIEKLELENYLFGMLIKSVKEGKKPQCKEESEMMRIRLMECRKKING